MTPSPLTRNGCAWLTIFLHHCIVPTAALHLLVPNDPVLASAGHDAILPCSLSPQTSAVAMAIRWFKEERFVDYLYLYDDGKGSAGKGYEGKVDLFNPELEQGNVSLLLRNVAVSDSGRYKCQASHEAWIEEMPVDLQVIQHGSMSWITLIKHHRTSVELSCSSDSWSLMPKMTWTNHNGKAIAAETPRQWTTQYGLFSVTSHVRIGKDHLNGVTCVVTSLEGTQRLESTIQITEEFFLGSVPDRVYISAILIPIFLGLLSITASVIFVWHVKTDTKVKLKPFDKLQRELKELETVHSTCTAKFEEEKELLERNGRIADSVWTLIVVHKVEVTLDPDTAHPKLMVSQDNKAVRFGNEKRDHSMDKRFEDHQCVLGKEGYDSGIRYWEVDLGGNTQWSVGVAEEPVERGGTLQMYPENGYWSICLNNGKLKTVENPPMAIPTAMNPKSVGVLLDYENGKITFFNSEEKYVLRCFSGKFKNKLYPFFGPLVGCNNELKLLT